MTSEESFQEGWDRKRSLGCPSPTPNPSKAAKWSLRSSEVEVELKVDPCLEIWVNHLTSHIFMFFVYKMEMVISTWSFHRSVKRIRWKQGYGIILKTNSSPRYEGITVIVIFPKALFLLGVSHTTLAGLRCHCCSSGISTLPLGYIVSLSAGSHSRSRLTLLRLCKDFVWLALELVL